MTVLFTHSYFYKLDPKQWAMRQPYPPLGTLYAASYIRSLGYKVKLHDVNLCDGPDEILRPLFREQPNVVVIYDDGFNYLTKMCLTTMRQSAIAMIQHAKHHNCSVIVCSSDSTDHHATYLESGANYVVRGEGEETLRELIGLIDSGKHDASSIAGVAFMTSSGIHVSPARPVMRDLDRLPMPAWDLVDVDLYRQTWDKRSHFHLSVATTRGCPYKCNWCAKPIYGNRYNVRSAEHVVQELAFLRDTYGVSHFWLCDDIFGLKPGWLKDFARCLHDAALKVHCKIQSRADLIQSENDADDLVAAGVEEVWLGAESGSQRILDAMEKGITIHQIRRATELLKGRNIRVGFFIQLGYLGETASDIRQTISMILQLMPDRLGISVAYPLPGTRFYELVKSELQDKANWIDSADLAMMFNNTYPAGYYRILHRFIHMLYHAKQSRLQFFHRLKTANISGVRDLAKWMYYSLSAFHKRLLLLLSTFKKATALTHHT